METLWWALHTHLYMYFIHTFYLPHSILMVPCKPGIISIIKQPKKSRLQKAKSFAKDHTASKWQVQFIQSIFEHWIPCTFFGDTSFTKNLDILKWPLSTTEVSIHNKQQLLSYANCAKEYTPLSLMLFPGNIQLGISSSTYTFYECGYGRFSYLESIWEFSKLHVPQASTCSLNI